MFKVTIIFLIALALLPGPTGKPIPRENLWDFEGGGFETALPLHKPADMVPSANIWYKKSDFQTKAPDTHYKGTLTRGSLFDYRLIIGTLLGLYIMIFTVAVAAWGYDKFRAKKLQDWQELRSYEKVKAVDIDVVNIK